MTRPGPVLLPSNQFDHFYLGGDRIGALRGGPGGPRRPEEWIASATTRFGEPEQGLSRLPDGTVLRDRVRADPQAWLGPEHMARYGGEGVELLVKLLDAGQRLPVHLHPTRRFAREHLGLAHGKTEAWVVVDAEPGAVVGLGFRQAIPAADVAAMVAAHDSAGLVQACRVREVRAGDGILVPSGTPHFIGAGVFVVELQEPTDLSILLEWEGLAVDGDRDGHLGLGFEVALTAVDLEPWSEDDVARHVVPGAGSDPSGWAESLAWALPDAAQPYFRAQRMRSSDAAVEPGFAVLLVLAGEGEIVTGGGVRLPVHRGDAVLVPWCAGTWALHGAGPGAAGILCRPPAPDAPDAPR